MSDGGSSKTLRLGGSRTISNGAGGSVTVAWHAVRNAWLITLNGEHDISSAPILEGVTRDALQSPRDVVVDLGPATFIDCSVIGWLLRAQLARLQAGQSGFRIVVGPPGGFAARMLERAAASSLLNTEDADNGPSE